MSVDMGSQPETWRPGEQWGIACLLERAKGRAIKNPVLYYTIQFSSVQSLSRVWLFATPWITARQASLSITNSRNSLKLMSIESVMPSSHLILCRPLLFLLPIPPSIRVFSNESTLRMRWPKYWRFSFSIIPSKEIRGLISFRMDWLDLLAVQGTLKSLLQHHSSKTSILRCSAFFIVQLSHPYMTTGKTIALTRWTFVGKVYYYRIIKRHSFICSFSPTSSSTNVLPTQQIWGSQVSKNAQKYWPGPPYIFYRLRNYRPMKLKKKNTQDAIFSKNTL